MPLILKASGYCVSGKSLKRQLQMRSEDGQNVEDLLYRWMPFLLKSVGLEIELNSF